MEMLQLG